MRAFLAKPLPKLDSLFPSNAIKSKLFKSNAYIDPFTFIANFYNISRAKQFFNVKL